MSVSENKSVELSSCLAPVGSTATSQGSRFTETMLEKEPVFINGREYRCWKLDAGVSVWKKKAMKSLKVAKSGQIWVISHFFSVSFQTPELQMSVRLSVRPSVTKTPQPLRIAPIDHWAYPPSSLSTSEPIHHQAYRPSSLSTIKPINHWAYWPLSLLTTKPINHRAYWPSSHLSRLLSLLDKTKKQ